MRVRSELRSRWRAWLTLAVLAGLGAGAVSATVAGAKRTDTAASRYQAAGHAFDVYVVRSEPSELDFSRIERLPQVARSARSADLLFWGRTESGRPVTVNEAVLNAPINALDGGHPRHKFVAGRAPDPASPHEIYVGSRAADKYDLRVGSTLRLRVATPREMARIVETGEHDPVANPETAGSGPLLSLRVVGVRVEIQSEDEPAFMSTSRAFLETYGPRSARLREMTGVRLKRGNADLDAFRAGVERIAGEQPFEFWAYKDVNSKLRSSVHLQAQGLRVLALLGGIAVLLLAGQALARQATLESSEHPLLRSLGMTRRQLFALGLLRVAAVAAVAGAVAFGVAVALSPLAPIGAARMADPDPGLTVDIAIVGGGAMATAALLLLAALVPAWRASRPRPQHGRPRSSTAVDLLARAGFRPSRVTGVRMALEPGRGRTSVPVRATLLAAIVGVAAVAGTLTITASADHLLGTPRLYGQNWDAVIAEGIQPRYPERLVSRLRTERSVGQLAAGTLAEARVGGKPTGVLAMDSIRGSLSPTVLEGRPPDASNEILLGTKTARFLEVDIGDTVEASIARRASVFRVVGRGVLPDFGSAVRTLGLGNGVATTFQGVRRIDPRAQQNVFLVGLRPGADRTATLARLDRATSARPPRRPADVGNWGRVSGFPYLFAGLIAAAAAALLAHALVTSIRRRRRDLAILKTLGFERRDLRATVAWQATTVAAMGLLVGLPLGVLLGRFAWNLFATELGVVSEPVAPAVSAFLVIPATLLLANLVAVLPGRIAAGTRPALVLRAE
jgi:ABC-type lipoprotein release transport system permease subunit